MLKLLLIAGVALILVLASFAQSVEPLPAPADVRLQFSTEGDQQQFRLGELIPVKFSYSANVGGRYLLISQNNKLAGGRGLEVSCSPPAELVNSSWPVSDESEKFGRMLIAPCDDLPLISTSGCSHCDSEYPLSPQAIIFPGALNKRVRFPSAGTYTCYCSSADVTMDSPDARIRSALLVKSNAVVLNIVDDPAWARSAAVAYADAYDKLCRGDDLRESNVLPQCFDIASRITYLDTLDSLATEVRLFDGRDHGWGNGFWEAIQQTAHPKDALRLMASRIQEPDFQVSYSVLQTLAIWDLRIESSDAFQTGPPVSYHIQAIDKLRKYVRLLGDSLSHKNRDVLAENAKTYSNFAEQYYCEPLPLIPISERDQVLTAVGVLQ